MSGSKSQQRNSSIELLRILSMIMIVFHHFAIKGGFEWDPSYVGIPLFWFNLMVMGGKIGVNVFVLISGYFLVSSKGSTFNLRRILKFWGQVFFYSIAIYVVFGICGISGFGLKSLASALLPITFSTWWFASIYFVLYLLHPFMNKLLHSLDQKTYQSLLAMLVVCWSVIPTFTATKFQANSLLWFMTIYAIGGYARLYGFNPKFKTKHYLGMCGVFSVLTYATSVVFTFLGTKWHGLASHAGYFYGQEEKLTVLLISVSLFMAFAAMEMNYHKWINVIASATFGVYLIHENQIVQPVLWLKLFRNFQYQDSLMLIPYSIFAVAIVFAVCTVIDLIRQKVFEKPFMMLVDKYMDSFAKPFVKLMEVCKSIVFGQDANT